MSKSNTSPDVISPLSRATLGRVESTKKAVELINQLYSNYQRTNKRALKSELFTSTTFGRTDTTHEVTVAYNEATDLAELDWLQDEMVKINRR